MRKLIQDLQDEKYQLIQNSQDIKEILNNVGLDNDKIENLTPYSLESIEALLVWYGDGYYEEIWTSSDIYCFLKSYAHLVYKEGGLNV